MPRTSKHFKFTCQRCHAESVATCPKCGVAYVFDPVNLPGEARVIRSIAFPRSTWERMEARARITPGLAGPSEFVRLAVNELLASTPERVIK